MQKTNRVHERDELAKSLQVLNATVIKQNKLSRRFLVGIVQGLGAAIGAGAVAGIVFKIISSLGLMSLFA